MQTPQQVLSDNSGNTQRQESQPRYDIKFVPHPQLGSPYMTPVLTDREK